MAVWTIAKTTVGEAMRKKILNVFLLVAIAMIVLSLSFTQFSFRQDMTIVKSLGLLVILVAGFVISLILCVSLIPNEVERRTIYTILSKPVNRYEFILGKYLGGLITLFINIMLMGAVFIIMVTIKAALGQVQVPSEQGVQMIKPQIFDPSLILGIVMVYMQFLLFSAVVMFFSVFLTPMVNYFASTAVYVVGSASGIWMSMASPDSTAPPLVKMLYLAISKVMPNFDDFNIQNRLIHPTMDVPSLALYVVLRVSYALLYSTVVMLAAVIRFERKEV